MQSVLKKYQCQVQSVITGELTELDILAPNKNVARLALGRMYPQQHFNVLQCEVKPSIVTIQLQPIYLN